MARVFVSLCNAVKREDTLNKASDHNDNGVGVGWAVDGQRW